MHTVECNKKTYTPSKVVCVGKNFEAHIAEMGGARIPAHPAIFFKPNSAIAWGSGELTIPSDLGLLHHEVELTFLVGKTAKGISVDEAEAYIAGYGVGIDFTLRKLQALAKEGGKPWALSKGFDNAAALGTFLPSSEAADLKSRSITLSVNGEMRQRGVVGDMLASPAEILAYTASTITVEEGDVFMCGTPSGVDEINDGDKIIATIEGLPKLELTVRR